MPKTIYAISDIHGHVTHLRSAIDRIDLAGTPEAHLFLLGDYMDRGPHSAQVLYEVKKVSESWPGRVVALAGNHEVEFLEWLDGYDEDAAWLMQDAGFETVRSFVTQDHLDHVLSGGTAAAVDGDWIARVNAQIKRAIATDHARLVAWLRQLPLYYETNEQIFVHAGIDEEAGEDWRSLTPDLTFTHKFPATTGSFHKTIVAGHVATSTMHPDGGHGVFFDGDSHYFIDGTVEETGRLNILKYTVETGRYECSNASGSQD